MANQTSDASATSLIIGMLITNVVNITSQRSTNQYIHSILATSNLAIMTMTTITTHQLDPPLKIQWTDESLVARLDEKSMIHRTEDTSVLHRIYNMALHQTDDTAFVSVVTSSSSTIQRAINTVIPGATFLGGLVVAFCLSKTQVCTAAVWLFDSVMASTNYMMKKAIVIVQYATFILWISFIGKYYISAYRCDAPCMRDCLLTAHETSDTIPVTRHPAAGMLRVHHVDDTFMAHVFDYSLVKIADSDPIGIPLCQNDDAITASLTDPIISMCHLLVSASSHQVAAFSGVVSVRSSFLLTPPSINQWHHINNFIIHGSDDINVSRCIFPRFSCNLNAAIHFFFCCMKFDYQLLLVTYDGVHATYTSSISIINGDIIFIHRWNARLFLQSHDRIIQLESDQGIGLRANNRPDLAADISRSFSILKHRSIFWIILLCVCVSALMSLFSFLLVAMHDLVFSL